jgi:hypothetical protein
MCYIEHSDEIHDSNEQRVDGSIAWWHRFVGSSVANSIVSGVTKILLAHSVIPIHFGNFEAPPIT